MINNSSSFLIDILLGCLHTSQPIDPASLTRLSSQQWDELAGLAVTRRVAPLMYHNLAEQGLKDCVPPPALRRLFQRYRHNTLKNLKFQAELAGIVAALEQAGIPVMVLKGAYLAAVVYQNLGLREMGDLDILVKKGDLEMARQTLLQFGYGNSAGETPSASYQHLPLLQKPGAVSGVEMHWVILPETSPYRIDTDGLWQRARPYDILGATGRGMAVEDLVLHICLHAAYLHNMVFGLRPLCDLAEIIRHSPPDWELLAARADQWGCLRGMYLMLHFARELLGAAVPEPWLAQFSGEPLAAEVVAFARTQILGDRDKTIAVSHNFLKLYGRQSVWGKVRVLTRSVFLPPAQLAQIYGLPDGSLRTWLYYPRRGWDLLARYGPSAQQAMGNTSLSDRVNANNLYLAWLSEK